MKIVRRCSAGLAMGASGVAVMSLQWWAFLVVVPGVVFALAIDPD